MLCKGIGYLLLGIEMNPNCYFETGPSFGMFGANDRCILRLKAR